MGCHFLLQRIFLTQISNSHLMHASPALQMDSSPQSHQKSPIYTHCVCVCSFSLVLLSETPWTVTRQAPLPVGFSRQEYWSRLPFPLPGYFPDPEIEPKSPALAGRFPTTEPPRNPYIHTSIFKIDNQQKPTVKQMELFSKFCNNLNGKRI